MKLGFEVVFNGPEDSGSPADVNSGADLRIIPSYMFMAEDQKKLTPEEIAIRDTMMAARTGLVQYS